MRLFGEKVRTVTARLVKYAAEKTTYSLSKISEGRTHWRTTNAIPLFLDTNDSIDRARYQ